MEKSLGCSKASEYKYTFFYRADSDGGDPLLNWQSVNWTCTTPVQVCWSSRLSIQPCLSSALFVWPPVNFLVQLKSILTIMLVLSAPPCRVYCLSVCSPYIIHCTYNRKWNTCHNGTWTFSVNFGHLKNAKHWQEKYRESNTFLYFQPLTEQQNIWLNVQTASTYNPCRSTYLFKIRNYFYTSLLQHSLKSSTQLLIGIFQPFSSA